MIILGIDTSAQTASAAVCSEDRIIACGSVNAKLTHSQTIMPLVTSLLEAAHISLDGVDAFAVSKGPGSFTGIRIGVSAVKGLAFAKSKPCIGVSTLSALAYNMLGFDGIICPVMDARCSQVYNAVFRISGGAPERLCPDRAISISELKKELSGLDEKIYLVGDGAELCFKEISGELKNIHLAPPALINQLGSSVCAAAFSAKPCNAAELMPEYLRLPQAQRERNERLKKQAGDIND